MTELSSRSFLFFLTSLLKSVGLLCLTFFMTPLLLRYIGAADFGTFKVLMEVYGYLSLLELGLYSSLITCLIPLLKGEGRDELGPMLSEGRRLYLQAGILTFAVGALLYPFLTYFTSWERPNVWHLYLTYAMVLVTAFLIPFQPYKIYLEASNQGHKVNVIIFFQNLTFILIGVGLAYFGWGLMSQGAAVLLSNVIGIVLIRHYSRIRIKTGRQKAEEFFRRIRQYQRPQVLNDLATKICLNCDQLIIGIVLGPVMVTKVFLGQRVVLIMQGQLQSLGQASYASLGSLYYSDRETFQKRFMEVTKLLSTMGAATLVPICVLNQPFISLWVGEGYQMESNALTYLASGNAFLYGLFSFWNFIFTVLGKPSEITRMIWKQAVVNVVASVGLTFVYGGVGPIAGTLLSFVLVPLWIYPKLLKEHFNLSEPKLMASVFWPLALGVLPLWLYHHSPWKLFPESWLGLIVSGALIFGIYSCFLFLLLFNREERKVFLNRLGLLWKRIFAR